jgi:biotin transport system substrate-specific component
MNKEKIQNMVLCAMFAALIAIGAFIRIPIPFIPFTLQVTFTTLAGYILGSKKSMISVLVYVFTGLIGLPVFTSGGGPSYILKPTFGYLIGFVIGSYITGKITEKSSTISYRRLLFAGLVGLASVYVIGIVYCYLISRYYLRTDTTMWQVFVSGFLLVAPGNIAFTFVAAYVAKRLIPILNRRKANAVN